MSGELQVLVDYLRSEFGHEGVVDPNADLLHAQILDSFSIVTLAAFAQERFGVEFEPDDLVRENLATLSKLVSLIQSKQASA